MAFAARQQACLPSSVVYKGMRPAAWNSASYAAGLFSYVARSAVGFGLLLRAGALAIDAVMGVASCIGSCMLRALISAERSVCMHSAQVTGSLVYRTAASKLYPVISSVADPALDRITHSPYYSAVLDHLRPVPQPALSSSACCPQLANAPIVDAPIVGAPMQALACVHC